MGIEKKGAWKWETMGKWWGQREQVKIDLKHDSIQSLFATVHFQDALSFLLKTIRSLSKSCVFQNTKLIISNPMFKTIVQFPLSLPSLFLLVSPLTDLYLIPPFWLSSQMEMCGKSGG